MGKLVDISFRNGSYLDMIGGAFQTPTDINFEDTEKGLAANFNGTSSWIDCSNATGVKCVEVWFYNQNSYSTGDGPYCLLNSTIASIPVWLVSGTFILSYASNIRTNLTELPQGWYHYVLLIDGASSKIYLNTIDVTSAVVSAPTSVDFDDFQLGRRGNGTYYSDVYMLEVRLYDSVLTMEEIENSYKEFQNAYLTSEAKRNFVYPKPTDLSHEVSTELGTTLITNGDFESGTTGWTAASCSNTVVSFAGQTTALRSEVTVVSTSATLQSLSWGNGSDYRLKFKYYIPSSNVRDKIEVYGIGGTSVEYYEGTVTDQWVDVDIKIRATPAHTGLYFYNGGQGLATIGDVYYWDDIELIPYHGLVASWNMIPTNGALVDISGKGNVASIVDITSTPEGMIFRQSGYAYNTKGIPNVSVNGDVSFAFRIKFYDVSAYQHVIASATGVNDRIGVSIVSGKIAFIGYDGASVRMRSTEVLNVDQVYTIVVMQDSSRNYTFYIDGQLTGSEASTGTEPASTGFAIGARSLVFSNPLIGELYDLRVYNRILSTEEILAYHNQFADQIYLRDTFSDQGVGEDRPTGWEPVTGTYEVKELTTADAVLTDLKAGAKYLECVTDGMITIQSDQVYGEWEFNIYKDSDLKFPIVRFISDNDNASPNYSGYAITFYNDEAIYFAKFNGGAGSNLIYTAPAYFANQIWYGFKITRSFEGKFYFYIKGGSFGNQYVLMDTTGGSGTNPYTDKTYTTSKYMVFELDAGDRFFFPKEQGLRGYESNNILSAYLPLTM